MKGAITLLDGLIRVYSESQRVYHYATALTVTQTLGVFDSLGQTLDDMEPPAASHMDFNGYTAGDLASAFARLRQSMA
jgi:hypothetical protein